MFFGLTIIGLNLTAPPETHAHPAYGFTPPPPPPPPPPDGGGNGNDSDGDGENNHKDKLPPDYVIVQMQSCNLKSCSIDSVAGDTGQKYELLAAAKGSEQLFPLLVPLNDNTVPVEMLAHIRLIHEGSGWIAEGTISDAKSTRFALPYPGHWEVFLLSPPEFMTVEALDMTQVNLAKLQASLAAGPVSLGIVEANAPQTRWVKCPLACVIESPPPELPVTGAETFFPLQLYIGALLLWILAFLIYRVKGST